MAVARGPQAEHVEERVDVRLRREEDPRSDLPVTGFNMKFVESAGLVKFDFLGLKTLTVLSTAVELCKEKGVEIDGEIG